MAGSGSGGPGFTYGDPIPGKSGGGPGYQYGSPPPTGKPSGPGYTYGAPPPGLPPAPPAPPRSPEAQARLEEVVRAFGADLGTIHRLDEKGLLALQAAIGVPPPVVRLIDSVPVGKGMAGLAAERNEAVSSCNIQTDQTGDVRPGAKATGANGALVVPIRDAAGKAVGALGIGVNRPYEYTAEETARLIEAARKLV